MTIEEPRVGCGRPVPVGLFLGQLARGAVVVTVVGEIDSATAPQLDELLHTAAAERPEHLIIDLEQVTFFSAAGLAALLGARRRADDAECGVYLAGILSNRPVTRLLELTELATLFTVYPRAADALAAITGM